MITVTQLIAIRFYYLKKILKSDLSLSLISYDIPISLSGMIFMPLKNVIFSGKTANTPYI